MRESSRFASRSTLAAVFCGILLAMIGCGVYKIPESDTGGGSGTGGGTGGGSEPNFLFQMPSDGDLVDQVLKLRVSGDRLQTAFFELDGKEVFETPDPPFEWVLDPAEHLLGDHEILVAGQRDDGKFQKIRVNVTIARAIPISAIQENLSELQPGTWYEIPNSRLRAVAYDDPSDWRGSASDVIKAASGGCYDTKRDRLVIFGGGQGYSGNEIYAFDLKTAAWTRLTDPSQFPSGEESNPNRIVTHADGAPVSRHSYDYVEYIPEPVDRMVLCGGSGLYRDGGFSDPNTYFFDFDALSWEIRNPTTPGTGIGSISAVAADGMVWMHNGGNGGLSAFDPTTDLWDVHVEWDGWFGYGSTAEVHAARNELVALSSSVRVWNLLLPEEPARVLGGSIPPGLSAVTNPGLAYHPASERLVAWAGGKSVYTLDLETETWTEIQAGGSTDPGSAATRGTFGRWRYVPSMDLFIVVNSVDTNVFVFKLP